MNSNLKQNFGLTEEGFNDMLQNLLEGDEDLFKTIFFNHFSDCMNYLKHKYLVNHNDAYDITMDTLINFRTRCLQGKIRYGNLRFLYTQMAYHLFLKKIKTPSVLTSLREEDAENRETEIINEEERAVMNVAWKKLGDSCKKILTSFFYEKSSLADIAKALDKNPSAVRKQKQRCVEQLRLSFHKAFQNG